MGLRWPWSRRRRRVEAALAVIALLVLSELAWDLAHGSAGTYWVLKVTVVLLAALGIAALEAHRHATRRTGRPATSGQSRATRGEGPSSE